MRVIGMLFGIPEEDQRRGPRRRPTRPAHRGGRADGGRARTPTFGSEMFDEYIDWRIEHPSDDLMTELLHTEFEDETGTTRTLTRDEALLYTTVVAGAGNETTTRLIGWAGKVLAEHPDQRRELVEDRSLIPNAIEELLRYESPGPQIGRYVPEDVEVYGQTVPAGSAMLFVVGAANRDERRYDDPDRFDIHRTIGQHLAFGYGIHFCLGAALARLEGRDRARRAARPLPRVGRRPRPRAGSRRRRRCAASRRSRCSRPVTAGSAGADTRRRYDSTLRRERAARDARAHRHRGRRARAGVVDPRLARRDDPRRRRAGRGERAHRVPPLRQRAGAARRGDAAPRRRGRASTSRSCGSTTSADAAARIFRHVVVVSARAGGAPLDPTLAEANRRQHDALLAAVGGAREPAGRAADRTLAAGDARRAVGRRRRTNGSSSTGSSTPSRRSAAITLGDRPRRRCDPRRPATDP